MPQSKNTGQNPDEGISDFRISGQFFIKENYHNSRTSKDIDMKLGLVPKFDTRNTITSKKIDDDVMSGSCDVIAGAIRKPDSECMVLKTYIFLTVTFYLRKAENRTKKFRTQLSYNFCSNNADTSNIKKVLLLTKLQDSNIVPTNIVPPPPPESKSLKSSP